MSDAGHIASGIRCPVKNEKPPGVGPTAPNSRPASTSRRGRFESDASPGYASTQIERLEGVNVFPSFLHMAFPKAAVSVRLVELRWHRFRRMFWAYAPHCRTQHAQRASAGRSRPWPALVTLISKRRGIARRGARLLGAAHLCFASRCARLGPQAGTLTSPRLGFP